MKIKHLITPLAALLVLAASCEKEIIPSQLDEVQVSSSYLSIPVDGSAPAELTVTATDAWEFEKLFAEKTGEKDANGKDVYVYNPLPAWLQADKVSGPAGTTTVKLTAGSTLDGRSAELRILCAGKEQIVNVIQGVATVSPATCAEIIAGPESKTYRVTGICTGIYNTTYGNWYLNDGTGEIVIYGTLNKGEEKKFSSLNPSIEVGDEVTVEGPKQLYNGTVELVNVTVIKVNKSLIKVDSLSTSNFTSDGGDAIVFLTNKGNTLSVEIPADAQSWLFMKAVTANTVTLHAAANTAGPRQTTLVFKTTAGGKTYTSETTVSQDGLSGTADLPFTVTEAIAFANKVGGESSNDVYVKGIVSRVLYTASAKYPTTTFWISEDGTCSCTEDSKSTEDPAHDFEAYSVYWFGNQPWAEGNAQVSVGDEVIICGKTTVYNGIAETSSKKAYVYSVNGVQTDANGLGSEAYPFNVAGGIAAANAACTANVFVKGIVSKILYTFSASYGTGTFWLSDDGTYNGAENGKSTTDFAHDFEAYSVYWLNNQPWAEGDGQVEVGDKVTVYGQLTLYNSIAETASKKAHVYSVEKP